MLDDLNMMVEMQQFELPTAQVDTTLQFTDLSTEPVIISEPTQTSVSALAACSTPFFFLCLAAKEACTSAVVQGFEEINPRIP